MSKVICDICEKEINSTTKHGWIGSEPICRNCAIRLDPGAYVCDKCDQLEQNCVCYMLELEENSDT